jgi:hypothetical protein
MRRIILFAVLFLFVIVIVRGPAPADPRHIWQLNFHRGVKKGDADPFDPDDGRKWLHALPQPIVIKNETERPEVYWYLLYTIQNPDQPNPDEPGINASHSIFINVHAISDKANAAQYAIAHKGKGSMYSKESALYNDLPNEEVKRAVVRKLMVEGVLKSKGYINEEKITEACKLLWGYSEVCLPEKLDVMTEIRDDEMDEGINLRVLKPGETHRCIAIFNKLDIETCTIKVYFLGLTNDWNMTTHLEDPSIGEFERLIREKVLELTFERKGDDYYTVEDEITFIKREWATWTKKIRVDLKHDPSLPGKKLEE